ncbi:MAG: CDP-glycerol glycerophosphotransferase family protein [Nitrospinales bacterium]
MFFKLTFMELLYDWITQCSLDVKSTIVRQGLIFARKVVGVLKIPLHSIVTASLNGPRCEEAFKKFFDERSIVCVVFDTARISSQENEKELILKMRGALVRFAHKNHIPLYMISHGVSVKYQAISKANDDPFISPDVVALCNEDEKITYQSFQSEDTRMVIRGDTRYDLGWIRTLEESARNLAEYQSLSKPGKIALYLVANLNWVNDERLLNSIHTDICKLLDTFEDLTLWVKLHPRYPLHFPLAEYGGDRLKLFGNDTDTNLLLAKADIVISPLSAVLFHPMLMKRRAIFYDRLRTLTGDHWKCIFDEASFLDTVTTPEALQEACRKILQGEEFNFDGMEAFYKKYLSGGAGFDESIVENHARELLRLCKIHDEVPQ